MSKTFFLSFNFTSLFNPSFLYFFFFGTYGTKVFCLSICNDQSGAHGGCGGATLYYYYNLGWLGKFKKEEAEKRWQLCPPSSPDILLRSFGTI
ncbi:hypothetical protein BDD12DRAFT_818191 [Trichophaea hybrida]|nr:hypothetical protein BDD12DRAFT_818191 [Trichophaea hybrida]